MGKKICLEVLGPAKILGPYKFRLQNKFWPKRFFGSEKHFGSIMFYSVQQNFGLEKFLSRKTLSIKAFQSEKKFGSEIVL